MKVNHNFNDQEKDVLWKSASIINKFKRSFKGKDITIEFSDHRDNDFIYDLSQIEEIIDFLVALSKDDFEIDN